MFYSVEDISRQIRLKHDSKQATISLDSLHCDMGYEANRFAEMTRKAFELIERLSNSGIVSISELSRDLDISKRIVYNHPSTLRELEYVTKEKDDIAFP